MTTGGTNEPAGSGGSTQPAGEPVGSGGRNEHPLLAGRRLYLCTPDRPDLERFVGACVRGGVDLVQLREKELEARPLLARARALAALCSDLGVPFLLNDRPDLALACGADGVHVGQEDAPVELCRRLLGPDALVGLSTHDPSQLEAAGAEALDYVSVGPVVATPTKPGRPGVGLGLVTTAATTGHRPFFVTGGATPSSVPGIVAAGATRVVVVRWLTEASDPETAARELRTALDRAVDSR